MSEANQVDEILINGKTFKVAEASLEVATNRLIEAAPELLEACFEAFADAATYGGCISEATGNMLRKAYMKATGLNAGPSRNKLS